MPHSMGHLRVRPKTSFYFPFVAQITRDLVNRSGQRRGCPSIRNACAVLSPGSAVISCAAVWTHSKYHQHYFAKSALRVLYSDDHSPWVRDSPWWSAPSIQSFISCVLLFGRRQLTYEFVPGLGSDHLWLTILALLVFSCLRQLLYTQHCSPTVQ